MAESVLWDIGIYHGEDAINFLYGCTWAEVRKFIDLHIARSNEKCTYTISKSKD